MAPAAPASTANGSSLADETATNNHASSNNKNINNQVDPLPDELSTATDNGYRYGSFQAPVSVTINNNKNDNDDNDDASNALSAPGGSASGPPKPTSSSSPPPSASAQRTTRVLAPDLLRGLLMVLMAMDHVAVILRTWSHGLGRDGEADGFVVRRFNFTLAYVVRLLTHLCAPGFTFLLGMGVVYLARSRSKLGWPAARLARHFAVRALVLTLVTMVLGWIFTGFQVWFMNMVLFELGVDYLLAGLLWIAMDGTEKLLAAGLAKTISRARSSDAGPGEDEEEEDDRPLLGNRAAATTTRADLDIVLAESLSWHTHNVVLLILAAVTIWWNHWLSEFGGHCVITTNSIITTDAPTNPFLRIWFYNIFTEHVMSNFPPLAWLSFAILGLLYGRIMTARPWTQRASAVGHAAAGVLFAVLFVLTRALQFGNLSADCLQTPAQDRHPSRNPYLASPASFFYIVKYPPDVAFLAFTLAGNLLLLAAFTALPVHLGKRLTLLLDLGSSALFFYLAHFFTLIGISAVVLPLFGRETGHSIPGSDSTRGIENLWGYFGVWALLILIVWPLCRWYSRFKSAKSADSIWRFF